MYASGAMNRHCIPGLISGPNSPDGELRGSVRE